MSQPNPTTADLANKIRSTLAGKELPPQYAKLYSQYTRLSANQPSLTNWRDDEALRRFRDAMRILEAAFIEKELDGTAWQDSFRRTAELLEWLSHPDLAPKFVSTRLFSAALYQLAGYPARASGILNNIPDEERERESEIIHLLLKADFRKLFGLTSQYWNVGNNSSKITPLPWEDIDALSERMEQWVLQEVVGSLGILCASMRWGDQSRISLALDKLKAVAKLILHASNSYSWLLANLTFEVSNIYFQSTLRMHIGKIYESVNANGKIALDRYLRQSYEAGKNLAWPSQVRGIERLRTNQSFALCTPTGSGKTTIAELAILQSLFLRNSTIDEEQTENPLVIYLVPSRALAAEVETKLAEVLKNLDREPIIFVTGLYGGTDWGPTDAWITANDRTILICTYEKTEALLRFLGPLFIRRIKLIIIDEAHSIQYEGRIADLQTGDNRSLRLEALCMRILSYLDKAEGRSIALSAASSGGEKVLAEWIAGDANQIPVETLYRSTRQLIGRLVCRPSQRFEIRYDLLDGSSLEFTEENELNTPYIMDPFPPYPHLTENRTGVETRLRPYLFWAAINFAALDTTGHRHSVLISITQNISSFAAEFLELLEKDWNNVQLPNFFQEPEDPEKKDTWLKCLNSCQDYFSKDSHEYQLLKRGIVVHHGKMPGIMGRLLVKLIREQIAYIVLATSTLTEGVNLPFETILIPTLRRGASSLDAREFNNLVGRAGRPGVSTEGKSLVLLTSEPMPSDDKRNRRSLENALNRYTTLLEKVKSLNITNDEPTTPLSPLAELMNYLYDCWRKLSTDHTPNLFWEWLEKTAPVEFSDDQLLDPDIRNAIESLDSLDGILLSSIVEIEELENQILDSVELEKKLINIWQRSYAYFANTEEEILEKIFVRRGQALKEIYPNISMRRRLYRTSLQPRSGSAMLSQIHPIREHLVTGDSYATWQAVERFNYIKRTVELISEINKFNLEKTPKKDVQWNDILQWWLDPTNAEIIPDRKQVSGWFDYVSKNFSYKFNWGLGSFIAIIIDDVHEGQLKETKLDEWHLTGLPWIVLWIKELIIWGTLEPVAAYLLAQGMEFTRDDAEKAATIYYQSYSTEEENSNNLLDPRKIRDWAMQSLKVRKRERTTSPPSSIQVELKRDFAQTHKHIWRVLPVATEDKSLHWFDPAGYLLAVSMTPENWDDGFFNGYDFILDSSRSIITSTAYL